MILAVTFEDFILKKIFYKKTGCTNINFSLYQKKSKTTLVFSNFLKNQYFIYANRFKLKFKLAKPTPLRFIGDEILSKKKPVHELY